MPSVGARRAGRLGEYRIIKTIADGENRVKLAEHTLTGAKVALKFISRARIERMNTGSQVAREIRYLRLLSHPHIIKLYEVITNPSYVILVMEYAPDELFMQISTGGRMTEDVARPYFQQIMFALAYSHSLQVVHRDLKPENVLLASSSDHPNGWKVKLADFGLSNEWADGDWLRTGCGTPHYAAPEIIQGKLYGVEVDVWSCGAILYVMVCGCLPYEHENMAVLFNKIGHADYKIPEDLALSDELISLIDGMMTVDPTKRMTVPEVLAHPWTRRQTPRYLRQLYRQHMPPPPPSLQRPVLSSLSSLVNSPTEEDANQTSNWDDGIVDELIAKIRPTFPGPVTPEMIIGALDSPEENAVKVAYAISVDRRAGYDLRPVAEHDESEQMNGPESLVSRVGIVTPAVLTPHPELGYADSEEDDDEDNPYFVGSSEQLEWRIPSTIAVVEASRVIASESSISDLVPANGLNGVEDGPDPPPPHTNGNGNGSLSPNSRHHHHHGHHSSSKSKNTQKQKQRRLIRPKPPVWHFGIRSVSPQMEVMLELYKSLDNLGIEWREKRGEWGARAQCCDGDEDGGIQFGSRLPPSGEYDIRGASKDDLDVYTIETRWRKRDVVVLMKLRLYRTDPTAFMVDFNWCGCYKASQHPNAISPYEREDSLSHPPSDAHLNRRQSNATIPLSPIRTSSSTDLIRASFAVGNKSPYFSDEPESTTANVSMLHPLLFFECACELIAELTGVGADEAA